LRDTELGSVYGKEEVKKGEEWKAGSAAEAQSRGKKRRVACF